TTNAKAASATRVAACFGSQARRASPSGRCNAKALGSSCPSPPPRPKYAMPCVTPPLRTWGRKGNALLRIASDSACRVDPFDKPKGNGINCVRSGPRYSLQAQGDFCCTAALGLGAERAAALLQGYPYEALMTTPAGETYQGPR